MIAMKRLALSVLLALTAAPALADESPGAAGPSTREIIDTLKPRPAPPRVRGIALEPPAPAPSIDMNVTFEFNSATLTAEARQMLDRLGEALNSRELADSRFQLAGHTDGVGSESFNLTLSKRRADAVKAYVSARHKIATARLESIGYGKTRLLDAAHPDAAANRRVQVTNMGQ